MNILGVGSSELVLIFLLVLMVAGPKRMIAWAYVAGTYVAKLRKLWQEASAVIKKELAEAGVEPEVVDTLEKWANPRTRPRANPLDSLVSEIKKPVEDAVKPVQDTLNEVKGVRLDQDVPTQAKTTPQPPQSAEAEPGPDGNATEPTDSDGTRPPTPGRFDAWTTPN